MSAESLGLSVPDETEMDRRAEAIADHVITTLGADGVARRTPRAMLIAGARLALRREQRAHGERQELVDALEGLMKEVFGALVSYQPALREVIGDSNFAIIQGHARHARAVLNRIREREGSSHA